MADQLTEVPTTATSPNPRRHPSPWPTWARVLAWVVVAVATYALALLALQLLDRSEFSGVALGGPVQRIDVQIARGDVELVPGTSADVVIERTTNWRIRRPRVDAVVDGTTARIRVDCPRPAMIMACSSAHRIEVPPGVRVDVRTDGGGSVSAEGLDGWVRVVTSNGPVTGTGLQADEFLVDTSGGRVELTFVDPLSRLDVTTGGGDVDLVVPGGPYEMQLSPRGGDLTVEVDSEKLAERTISVASDGGSITIRRPDS